MATRGCSRILKIPNFPLLSVGLPPRGGVTAFRQWGQDFLFISFTACSPNFSGGNNIVVYECKFVYNCMNVSALTSETDI